jgi:hypothetical protein
MRGSYTALWRNAGGSSRVPARGWNNSRMGTWSLPSPIKLRSRHMTFMTWNPTTIIIIIIIIIKIIKNKGVIYLNIFFLFYKIKNITTKKRVYRHNLLTFSLRIATHTRCYVVTRSYLKKVAPFSVCLIWQFPLSSHTVYKYHIIHRQLLVALFG